MFSLRTLILLLCAIVTMPLLANAQSPTADYTANVPSPACVPLTIPFTDASSNATSYSWTIGGVFFSDEANPERIFTTAGSYEICQIVTNSNGVDTLCSIIDLYTGPDLGFNFDTPAGCAPLAVNFTATSSATDIASYTWDFGDGTIINTTDANYTHTYNSSSLYDVTLIAYNATGCASSETQVDIIDVFSDVTPQFSADNTSSCEAPLAVNFTNTSTGNLTNVSYSWDFGDNNTSSAQNPSHTYTAQGSYDVSLTITNDNTGCSNTTILPNYINIAASPMFSYTTDASGSCNEVSASFTNETPGNVVVYFWDFGDGNTSNLENPSHNYNTAGCHYPSLTVTTTGGCVVTYQSPTCVSVTGGISLSYTSSQPTEACQAPLTVSFNTSYSGNLEWDFGGQGTSTQQNPSFTFTQEGTYPVTLTALLANGCEESVTTTTVVIAPPTVAFEGDVLEGCAPLAVNFSDLTNVSGNITNWAWDFGDGNTSTQQNPSHTYNAAGEYDVTLAITLDNGCQGTITGFNYIQAGYTPPVNFEADPTETCIENVVGFTDLSNDVNIDYWLWDFGDQSFSGEQHPLHEYNDTGWFDVKLIVGYNSCYDSLTITDYTHLFPPKAIFYHNQDCSDPGLVTFTDSSIGADTWTWDFGDGNSSTDQNPTHFYTENGEYIVTLEVYNAESGCTDDMTTTIYVQVPRAEFELTPTDGCYTGTNVSLQVNNLSESAATYSWYAPGVFVVMNGANDPNPIFKFNSPGLYTGMQLTVTDAAGCQDVFIYEDTVTISTIDADFTFANIDSDCNQVFQFNDASISQFADITSWEWNFGDGNISNEQNPIHTYGQGGFYLPSLTVTNSGGCTDSYVVSNPLQVEVPFVTYNTDTLICLGTVSIFNNGSVASDFVSWEWDFGNGDTSTEWSPEYSYTANGTYTACLSATNVDGCIGTYCKEIVVEEGTVDFTADVTSASCSPLVVQFTDLSQNIVSWEWDFGDNTGISSLQNPAHTYTNSGSFDVCVTVVAASGCTQTFCKENFVQIGGPTAEITYTPGTEGCLDFDMSFNIDGQNINSYVMDYGDGTTDSGNSSNTFSLNHTYTSLGAFAPILLLEDAAGCQNFIELDTIRTSTLEVSAASSDNNICPGTALDFTSVIATPGTIETIEWFFEGADNTSSVLENPTGIVYNTPGSFDVILVVTTDLCSETLVLDHYIQVLPEPVLYFAPNPSTHCGATMVTFANSSGISSGSITSWEWDFGNGMTSTDEQPTPVAYDSTGMFVVTLLATSDNGCTAQFAQTVTILEAASAEILSEEVTLCQGQSTQLESNVYGTPSWSPATGLSCTNCPDPIANPNNTTTYILTATTASGCIAMDTIIVNRISTPAPVVTLTQDITICPGEMIQLIATGGTSPFDYSWDNTVDGLSCYENCSNPLVEITETTTFTVYVSNAEGCITSESITVSVTGTGVDVLGPDRLVCEGGSVQLETMAGTNPVWAASSSLSCLDCPNPVATPMETTTYAVTVSYLNCEVTEEITVEVLAPDAVYAGEDMSICGGEMITLNGDAPGNITWTSNGSVIATGNLNPEVSPTVTTTYILTASNDLCIQTDTVEIVVANKLELDVDDHYTCQGGLVQLSAGGNGITTFEWFPSTDLTALNVPNPIAEVFETTSYTVVGSNGLCEADTALVTVFITGSPEVILPPSQSFVPGSSVTITPTTFDDGDYTYNWSPNINISCTDCATTTVTPDSTTTYTLIVTSGEGCETISEITLYPITECLDDIIVVPTGFSPNNDGNNDELKILGLAEVELFRVFNRWGELMFESTDGDEGWDGTFKGKELDTGVYVWYAEAICPLNGTTISKKGDVTLIR